MEKVSDDIKMLNDVGSEYFNKHYKDYADKIEDNIPKRSTALFKLHDAKIDTAEKLESEYKKIMTKNSSLPSAYRKAVQMVFSACLFEQINKKHQESEKDKSIVDAEIVEEINRDS